jgi:hypothetical protein
VTHSASNERKRKIGMRQGAMPRYSVCQRNGELGDRSEPGTYVI